MTRVFKYCLLLIFASLFLSSPAFAERFYIENYDVSVDVDKLKQAHITETIDVYFTESAHGIFREIPHNNALIQNIVVFSEDFTIYRNNNSVNIKIGDADRYLTGKKRYTISYTYKYTDNKNEFYHNLIGTEWKVPIKHVTFNVNMPKSFDAQTAGISIGKYGTIGFTGGARFSIDDQIVSGETSRILEPGEGITLRISLPEGYFEEYKNTKRIFTFCFNILFLALAFIIWFLYGKDEKPIPIVSFYPPKGFNMLEVEIAYKETASTKGLVAMIFSLAQRGYLKISFENETDFTLTQLKDYTESDSFEKDFLKSIFANKTIVTSLDLEYSPSFYNKCKYLIDRASGQIKKIYEKDSVNKLQKSILKFCFSISLINTIILVLLNNILDLGATIGVLIMFLMFTAILFSNEFSKLFVPAILTTVLGLTLVFTTIETSRIEISTCLITTMLLCMFYVHMRKRNTAATRTLGILLGLKKFIETAEKNRLKMLKNENPEYFYDVLPFAYIFGISDKWIKQFESIMTLKPTWYEGDSFNFRRFENFTKRMNSLTQPITNNNGFSDSSSSGGGGFSGGGGGGGGGGSW